jgi:hypothetical protein
MRNNFGSGFRTLVVKSTIETVCAKTILTLGWCWGQSFPGGFNSTILQHLLPIAAVISLMVWISSSGTESSAPPQEKKTRHTARQSWPHWIPHSSWVQAPPAAEGRPYSCSIGQNIFSFIFLDSNRHTLSITLYSHQEYIKEKIRYPKAKKKSSWSNRFGKFLTLCRLRLAILLPAVYVL